MVVAFVWEGRRILGSGMGKRGLQRSETCSIAKAEHHVQWLIILLSMSNKHYIHLEYIKFFIGKQNTFKKG